MLAEEKGAAQVARHDGIPFRPGHVDGELAQIAARIVDEEVDLAECRRDIGDGALDAELRAEVEHDAE